MDLQAREATLAEDVWLENFGFVAVYTFCHCMACDAESLSLPPEKSTCPNSDGGCAEKTDYSSSKHLRLIAEWLLL